MVKIKKGQFQIYGAIGLIVIGLLIWAVFASGSSDGGILPDLGLGDNNLIECNAIVKNPVVGDPFIESFNCIRVDDCTFVTGNALTFFERRNGVLEMTTGDSRDIKQFDVAGGAIGGDDLITTKVCTAGDAGTLKLYDETGNLISQKNFEAI